MQLTQKEALIIQLGVIADALSIIQAKRRDYSGDVDPYGNLRTATALDIHPVVGAFNRMLDKLVRIKTMIHSGTLAQGGAVGESAADAFRDIINYDGIAAGLVAEEVPQLYEYWMDLGYKFQEILDQVTDGLFQVAPPAGQVILPGPDAGTPDAPVIEPLEKWSWRYVADPASPGFGLCRYENPQIDQLQTLNPNDVGAAHITTRLTPDQVKVCLERSGFLSTPQEDDEQVLGQIDATHFHELLAAVDDALHALGQTLTLGYRAPLRSELAIVATARRRLAIAAKAIRAELA